MGGSLSGAAERCSLVAMRRNLSIAGLALGSVLVMSVGCADDPMTTPDGQPLVFADLLEQGGQVVESLPLVEKGTIRIELTNATPLLIELPPSGELPFFTVGVGIGDESSGTCVITFGSSLKKGDNLTILVQSDMSCLVVFDDGTLPQGAVIRYTVTVEDVKS